MNLVMYNPVIVKKDAPYETEEGCLSLESVCKTTRYQNIEVKYMDGNQDGFFCGVAATSPSVWFPGRVDYMEDHTIYTGRVYLSLGDKED